MPSLMVPVPYGAPQLFSPDGHNFSDQYFDSFSMRRNRMIRSKKMYDLCFRSLQGLPLPARALTTLLIESILGRLIASEQVIVCSYVWMANHPHMQIFSLDANALIRFQGQLKKTLTDFLKRLLGLRRLSLWDKNTNIGEVLDLDGAINRVVYTFLNPVRAKLARSIDEYQGCNTWREFISAPAELHAVVEKEVPWILAPDIPQLSVRNPSLSEERTVRAHILDKTHSRQKHTLRIYPFRWMEAFGITTPEQIEAVRARIIQRVREEEALLAQEKIPQQKLEGFIVTNEYIPPPQERRIFMFGSTPEIRAQHRNLYRVFLDRCKKCFELLKQGVQNIPWPPGCFIPPCPQLSNAL